MDDMPTIPPALLLCIAAKASVASTRRELIAELPTIAHNINSIDMNDVQSKERADHAVTLLLLLADALDEHAAAIRATADAIEGVAEDFNGSNSDARSQAVYLCNVDFIV